MKLCECGCGMPAPIASANHTKSGRVKGQPSRFVNGHQNRRRPRSAEHRAKIAESLRGRTWGPLSPEHREKVAAAQRGKPREQIRGERHYAWKGDAVGYSALHIWVARHKVKTGACVQCGSTGVTTHWANLSGRYLRDLEDFAEMCVPCHKRHDLDRAKAAA